MKPVSDRDLVQAYLDGELSSEQAAMLESRLRTEPRLAELAIFLAREEAICMEWARAHAVEAEAKGILSIADRRARPRRRSHGWLEEFSPQALPLPCSLPSMAEFIGNTATRTRWLSSTPPSNRLRPPPRLNRATPSWKTCKGTCWLCPKPGNRSWRSRVRLCN